MKKYELTEEDYNYLNKLRKIGKCIKSIQDNLCDLEISFKKESPEYQTLLSQLQAFTMLEDKIYEKLSERIERLSELVFYLLNYDELTISDILYKINMTSEADMINRRIINRLQQLLCSLELKEAKEELEEPNYDELEESESEKIDDSDYENMEEIPEPEDIEKQFFYQEKLLSEIERDMLKTILKILSEYIHNPNYKNIQSDLIKFKYNLSYYYKMIEQDFIEHKYEIDSNLYWSAYTVIDFYNSNPDDLQLMIDSYAEEVLYEQGEIFIELIFKDLNIQSNYVNAVIAEIIIRSIIIFLVPEHSESFKNYYLNCYSDAQTPNPELEKIINNAVNNTERDRQLPIKVNLGLNLN